jgi:hypothetical protein
MKTWYDRNHNYILFWLNLAIMLMTLIGGPIAIGRRLERYDAAVETVKNHDVKINKLCNLVSAHTGKSVE